MHRTLSDFLADLYQNAVESGANDIGVDLHQDEQVFSLTLTDNGRGMDEQELVRAQDPFYTDGQKHRRRVGLGLPFVIQTLHMTGGQFQIESRKRTLDQTESGTVVKAIFNRWHWDTPPLGDLAATLSQMMALPGEYEVVVTRSLQEPGVSAVWQVKRSELQAALGNFEELDSLILLREFFRSAEQNLTEGNNDASRTESDA